MKNFLLNVLAHSRVTTEEILKGENILLFGLICLGLVVLICIAVHIRNKAKEVKERKRLRLVRRKLRHRWMRDGREEFLAQLRAEAKIEQ